MIRLFEETEKALGTLDILVNNAVFQQFLPIEQATVEAFHQHFNVNVLGLILTIQAALKLDDVEQMLAFRKFTHPRNLVNFDS